MENAIKEKIKNLSKDAGAAEELMKLFRKFENEKDKKAFHLELLESAIRNDYDSILITKLDLEDPGPEIVYVNDGFCEMTGYSKEEVIGKTPRILQGPKTDRKVLDELKRRLKKGQSFFGHTVNYRKDGSEFVNQWDIHPLTDRDGNITHWVSYQHDITERKRAEKMLVDTSVEFDNLREESNRTVLDVDEQGNIVMANKSFRELVNYSKDELKRIKAWDLFPRKYRDSLRARFDGANAKEEYDNREFKGIIKHKSGMPIQIQGRTKILDLKENTLVRCEVKNISLQKRIIGTLKKKNRTFNRIFNKASEYNYNIKREDGEIILDHVSAEFPELTGLSILAVNQGDGFSKFIHEDDLEKVMEHLETVLDGQHNTCEYRIQDKEGNYLSIIDYAKPQWDEQEEKVIAVRGAVSRKKSAETG